MSISSGRIFLTIFFSDVTSNNQYEAYEYLRIATSRAVMEKCTEQAGACSALEKIGDTDDEEVASCMDEATRKRVTKEVSITLNFAI